jgi:pectate lyase
MSSGDDRWQPAEMKSRFGLMALGVSTLWSVLVAAPTPVAFPGAEGAGAQARGGRGGRVVYVSNLHDSGPGSLRDAVEARGPRTVIFAVDGTIELESVLEVKEPFLTLAGQTAPGGGVCLKNFDFVISADHVIVQHLRFRPGDAAKKAVDGMSIGGSARDVIIDHCSVSWSVDECLSVSGNGGNITVQWCLIAESLNRSVHHKGAHGYGALVRADGDVTYHHNIFAHHGSRSPRPGTWEDAGKRGIILDFRNNVIYGWGSRAGYSSGDKANINYVGNYLKPHASSKTPGQAFNIGGSTTRIFVAGNFLAGAGAANEDNWKMLGNLKDGNRMDRPFPIAPVKTDTAEVAYERALAGAGATKPRRDEVDRRIVEQIRNGTGGIIDSQNEVGGWPVLAPGKPPPDRDRDGMPDAWENAHGLDANDPTDGPKPADGSGYTNLELYLHSLG